MSAVFPGLRDGSRLAFLKGMSTIPTDVDSLTGTIIAAAIEVHRALGPGLLESVYKNCLTVELRRAGLAIEIERRVPLTYRGIAIESPLIIDLVVEDRVVVEVKSITALAPVHAAQVVTYLKLTGLPAGLLLNFNVEVLKNGLRRLVHPALYRRTAIHEPPPDASMTDGHVS